jgi:hypothetical protein
VIELRPEPLAEVRPPVPKYLQEKYIVRFSDKWPSTMSHVTGKTFYIDKTNQVPYVRRYILPTADYRDVDLSNGTGTFNESFYPESTVSLFEISLGWKKGNYVIHVYVPADRHLHSLEYTGMYPQVTSATLRFLGARKPEDSPYKDHQFFIYAVKDLEPIILRHYILPGVARDKAIMGILVNKCHLVELTPTKKSELGVTEDQIRKAKVLPYHEELRW